MTGAENAERVRRYFETWNRKGLEAFLELLPADVEWHPYSSRPRKLWGSEELRSFWAEAEARGERVETELIDAETLDEDNVLVTGTMRRHGPSGTVVEQVAWLYSFRDGKLWRASGHPSVAEAREAARFLHTDRVRMSREGPHFAITLHQEPRGRSVVEVTGELDMGTADELSAAVREAAASGHVLIDLSRLSFMDSSGLRTLLEATRAAREDGWRLELRRGSDVVQRIVTLAGAERLLPFEPG